MIDESTEFGARVARHLREEMRVWLTTVTSSASILVAIGKDPTYVMQQLGHADPAFTVRVHAHAMRRSDEERQRLRALVEGHDWPHIGHKTGGQRDDADRGALCFMVRSCRFKDDDRRRPSAGLRTR